MKVNRNKESEECHSEPGGGCCGAQRTCTGVKPKKVPFIFCWRVGGSVCVWF